jgi:adenine-specific DNA methylase
VSDITCPECGIFYGVPDHWLDSRKQDKKSFYCPNGHTASYRESEADRLRRECDRLAQKIAEKDDEIARQRKYREEAERRHTAAKGQITKLRKRVGNGVCPCCNRTFGNLARHMTTEHPNFSAQAAE